MCGTKNDNGAQTCKFCGYIFENFNTNQVSTTDKYVSSSLNQVPANENLNTAADSVPAMAMNDLSTSSTVPFSTITSESPVFIVKKSVWSSILPSIAYLAFILFATASSGFSLYSVGIILFFIVVFTVPTLFSPRRFEFYDDRLVTHKIIGGDTALPFSDLVYNQTQRGNRSQMILSSKSGKLRQLVIPGNPTNKELGMDLRQFLDKKLGNANQKQPQGPKNAEGSTNPNTDQGTSDQTY
jgi:hypothetical protein